MILREKLISMATTPLKPRFPHSKHLKFEERVDFCNWHEALTSFVPEGIQAGYPTDIQFTRIPERLEVDWIRDEMDGLIKYPLRSKKWVDYGILVDKIGRTRWQTAQIREPSIALRQHVG